PCCATTLPEMSAIQPSAARAVRRCVIRTAAKAATTTTTVPSSSSTRPTRATTLGFAPGRLGLAAIVSWRAFTGTSCKHRLRTPEREAPRRFHGQGGQDRKEDRDLPDGRVDHGLPDENHRQQPDEAEAWAGQGEGHEHDQEIVRPEDRRQEERCRADET